MGSESSLLASLVYTLSLVHTLFTMPHSFGYRAGTRDLFSRPFRQHGPEHLSTYLHTYRIGDYVDVKANGAIHKGMPHKFYHGRTGVVWNVTPRAVGVKINKRVGNRIIKKKIHVRIEHVKHSRCREDLEPCQGKRVAKARSQSKRRKASNVEASACSTTTRRICKSKTNRY